MKVTDLRPSIGLFGELKAGEIGYKKTLTGIIKDMDTRGSVYFVDNDGYGHLFKADLVEYFAPKEYEPLPKEYKGKEIYWTGGRAYYKDSNKECDITK